MASYFIPEPTISLGIKTSFGYGKGTKLIQQNAAQYAFKPNDSTEEWWAIGMMANNGSYWHPLIVSNVREYAFSYSDKYYGTDPLSSKFAEVEYMGITYYATFGAYGSTGGDPSSAIPVYSEVRTDDIPTLVKTLIRLYVSDGGTLPGQEAVFESVEHEPIGWKNDGPPDISAENLGKMDETIGKLCTNLNVAHEELEADIQELAETIGAITTTQF
jgi:hypothetical protein